MQVKRRTAKVRRSKTNVLPLCRATSQAVPIPSQTEMLVPHVIMKRWTYNECLPGVPVDRDGVGGELFDVWITQGAVDQLR